MKSSRLKLLDKRDHTLHIRKECEQRRGKAATATSLAATYTSHAQRVPSIGHSHIHPNLEAKKYKYRRLLTAFGDF